MRFAEKTVFNFLLATAVCCTTTGRCSAEQEKSDVNIDDYFTQAFISHCVMSHDSKQIVYQELRWEEGRERRNSDLWIASTSRSQPPKRLTFDVASDYAPQWSSDDKWIYFASARKSGDDSSPPNDGSSQVWRVRIDDGRVQSVTRVGGGITGFQLGPDGTSLYYTIQKKSVDDPWSELRSKYSTLEYGVSSRNVSELWSLSLNTWRAEKLIDDSKYIHDFSISPNDRRIAMITTSDGKLISMEGWSNVEVFEIKSGKSITLDDELWRDLAPSPYGWLESPSWSDDGQKLAFRVMFDGYPGELIVTQLAATAEFGKNAIRCWKLDRENEISISDGPILWRGNDLFFQAQERAKQRVYRISAVGDGKQGATTAVATKDVYIFDFSIRKSTDACAVIMATPKKGRDIFVVNSDEPSVYHTVTDSNPQIRTWKLPQISIVKWTSMDGTPVEGILELPHDHKPGDGPLPMILHIHGGPSAATPYCFRFWPYGRTLLPAKGYAVFSPNYRGSTGYGDKFMIDLVKNENDIEVKDILSGVDHLIKQGVADESRMGVMGWSNGGFLTNAIITRDPRFKAASSGAGVIDQVMQWGLEDTPGHVVNFMGNQLPWHDAEEYVQSSPLFKLDKVSAATLIHVGELDERVPASHSRTLFRGLHRYRKIPTQLVIYPGEPHSLSTYTHRKAKMEWDVAWFEKYVLQQTSK